MDRIGGVRAEDHVARRGDCLRHVGEAFLGAQGGDHLRIRVELHAETAGIISGLSAAQARNALGRGITVRARILHDLAQLVDDRLGSGKVGVSHAEIDDIGAARSRACFQTVDLFENIRRQTPDFVKLFHLIPHGKAAFRAAVEVRSVSRRLRHELQNRNAVFIRPKRRGKSLTERPRNALYRENYIFRSIRKALRPNCLKGKVYLEISESVSVPCSAARRRISATLA